MVAQPETFLGQRLAFLKTHLAQFEDQLDDLQRREPDDTNDATAIEIAMRQTEQVISELKAELVAARGAASVDDASKAS